MTLTLVYFSHDKDTEWSICFCALTCQCRNYVKFSWKVRNINIASCCCMLETIQATCMTFWDQIGHVDISVKCDLLLSWNGATICHLLPSCTGTVMCELTMSSTGSEYVSTSHINLVLPQHLTLLTNFNTKRCQTNLSTIIVHGTGTCEEGAKK